MGEQPIPADAAGTVYYSPQQGTRGQMALDEQTAPPLADQGHSPGGALRLCSGGDQVLLRDRSAQTVQQGAELVRGPHQDGVDQAVPPGGQHGLEGVLILGGGQGDAHPGPPVPQNEFLDFLKRPEHGPSPP